jgi:hypothetical protein
MFKLKQLAGAAVAAAALAFGAVQPAAAAISVNVVGAPATVSAGDSFSVDVVVSGITNEIIAAWDIDLTFSSALLSNNVISFVSVPNLGGVDNTYWDGIFGVGLTDAYALSLLSDADLDTLQCPAPAGCAESMTLASFGFTALSDGAPDIALANWGDTNDIKTARNQVLYPPNEIPEPTSLALVGIALAGGLLAGTTRRRRRG